MMKHTIPQNILQTRNAMYTYLNTIKKNNSGKLPGTANAIKKQLNSIYGLADRLKTTARITKKNISSNNQLKLKDALKEAFRLLEQLATEAGIKKGENNNNNNNNSRSVHGELNEEGEEPSSRNSNAASVTSGPSVGSDPGSTRTTGGRRRSRKTRRLRKTRRSRK